MSDNNATAVNAQHDPQDDAQLRLRELISGMRIAMATTIAADGELHSRPMYAQDATADGDLWFATSRSSSMVKELRNRSTIHVTFSDTDKQRYVVLRGEGFVRHDAAKIEELWNPAMKAWFPGGPSDPDLTLVRVEAMSAEYWDSPSAPVRWLQFVKALATGSRPQGGGHVTLDTIDSGLAGK